MQPTTQQHLQAERPMSAFQILMVAICFVLNFNDGIDIMLVSFSSTEIIAQWGLTKAEMGYVFSAALAGMTLGCFLLAPLADRIGRRKTFILALTLESIGMLGISICQDYSLMLFLRFLTGLGVGGLLPTMAATAAEFSNAKYRDFNVGLIQAGWPVGAILTGFFCAWFIPVYGWQPAFLIAGLISLLMLALVYFFMTDSTEFLLRSRPANALERINALQQKMKLPLYASLPEIGEERDTSGLKDLFSLDYKDTTIKTWIAVFFGFMTLYTLLSWVPTIAQDTGLPFEMATYVGVALNVGAAIGSASIGAIGSRFGMRQVILSFMLSAFSVMVLFANLSLSTLIIFFLIFLIGILVQGGFNGIWPLLARVYPVGIRTTGTGFAVGIGRFGAILGPILFGVLADNGVSISTLFIIFSVPLLLMGLAVWLIKSPRLKV
jgi:AAHS family 4-hydroxybenzoate transporter-like MFS transporter